MLFAGYITISLLVYGMVTATSEIASYLPVTGCSMAYYGARFVSRSLGFAMGWLYWYSFGILIAYEITAAALVINYWPNSVHIAVWITIMLVVIVGLNSLPVRFYAETEFWFASLKVFTIIGLLIFSFVLCVGGGPDHDRLGFSYWKDPGAAKHYLAPGSAGYFCAYLYVTTFSVFAFNFAPELLVITAGEMQNPRKNLPKAAKRYFYRLIAFYILGSLAVGIICSSNAPGLTNGTGSAASPWVIAIKTAGVRGLDSVINAVIITSAWSSGNSYLYMSSRMLYSLAVSGNAPKIFTRCNRWGLPYYAVAVSALFSLLAYLNVANNTSAVFNWLINLTNTAGFTSWICCCIIYLRFRKARNEQGLHKSMLPYNSFTQPWMAYVCMVSFAILLLCNGFYVFFPSQWSVSSFLTAYIGLPIFLVIYFSHRIYFYKDRWAHRPGDVDLQSGLDAVRSLAQEASQAESAAKRRWWHQVKVLWE